MNTLTKSNKVLVVALPIIYLIIAKLGANPGMNIWASIAPITAIVIALTLISPPVSVALVFMSHNLIGQITMTHPGMLMQIFPALALVACLLYVRRDELKLNKFKWASFRMETWALLLIIVVLFFGFIHGVLAQNENSFQKIADLFKASNGGSLKYYPYVFLSRWGLFILIGALCCRGLNEFRLFSLAFAISVISQLIAVPFSSYQWALGDMCFSRLNYDGLQALNVNRAYLGYLIGCAFATFLTFAIYDNKRKVAIAYYIGALVLLFLCIVTGSKGPVGAAAIAILFIFIRGIKKYKAKLIGFGVVFIILSISLPKLFGCSGGLQSILKSSMLTAKSSVSVRADLAESEYKKTENSSLMHTLIGGGLGASLSTVESTFINPYTNAPVTISSSSGSHNLFIDFYVDLGVIGLALFVMGLIVLVFSFFKNLKKSIDSEMIITSIGGVLLILLVYTILATAPSMATVQALFLGVLFGTGIKKDQING